MSNTSPIKNVAIVGANGTIGSRATKALLDTGMFNVTALTREPKLSLPAGITVKQVDYNSVESLTSILKGQDALIITLGFMAPPTVQATLITAAAAAGVPWVLPCEFGNDNANIKLRDSMQVNSAKTQYRQQIEDLGVSKWIGLVTSFWFDFSLDHETFWIDIKKRTAKIYDDGNTKSNTTLLSDAGLAVSRILSLPEAELQKLGNKFVYISSFLVSQNEILASVQRATGTSASDWTFNTRPADEAISSGNKALAVGDHSGFADVLVGTHFKSGAGGNYESTKGTHNELLGLPKCDLDIEVAKVVEQMA